MSKDPKDEDTSTLLMHAARPELMELVAAQAEDEALWIKAETAPEAYLQHALRALHEAAGEPPEALARTKKGEPPMEKSTMEDLQEALEAGHEGLKAALHAIAKTRKTILTLGGWLEKYGFHLTTCSKTVAEGTCTCGWELVLDAVNRLRQTEEPTEKAQGETDDRSS